MESENAGTGKKVDSSPKHVQQPSAVTITVKSVATKKVPLGSSNEGTDGRTGTLDHNNKKMQASGSDRPVMAVLQPNAMKKDGEGKKKATMEKVKNEKTNEKSKKKARDERKEKESKEKTRDEMKKMSEEKVRDENKDGGSVSSRHTSVPSRLQRSKMVEKPVKSLEIASEESKQQESSIPKV